MGIWMLFQYVNSRGPEITLILPDASGIVAGKTEIKARNVTVGTITKVSLSEKLRLHHRQSPDAQASRAHAQRRYPAMDC